MQKLRPAIALLPQLIALAPARAVLLEYRGEAGQVSAYGFTVAADSRLDAGGRQQTISSQGSLTVLQEVLKVDERGHLKVRLRFRNGSLSSSLARRTVVIPLRFPTVEMEATRTGNVLNVDVVRESATAPPAGAETSDVAGVPPNSSSDASPDFAGLFAHVRCLGFPDREVEVGDSWSLSGSLTQHGGETVRVNGVSRLTGIEQRHGVSCAVIHSELKIPLDSTRDALGVTAKTTGTSTVTLTAYFDLAAGRLHELLGTERANRTTQVSARSDDAGGGDPDHSAVIRLDSTVTFTMTLESAAP